jgi:predicted acylesterase/phospholipase RssA/CRP-like cAMP-binding protein
METPNMISSDIQILANLNIFSKMNLPALQALGSEFQELFLSKDTVLHRPGDPGDAFYVVLSGKLTSQAPGSEIAAASWGPGSFLGEIALLTGQSFTTSIAATEDTRLLRLSRATFEHMAEEHLDLYTQLTAVILPRYQQSQARLILSKLFGPLDDDLLSNLLERLAWRQLKSGEVLFRQGDPGDEMFVVVQGRLRFRSEGDGGTRELGEVGAGESIGEFALFSECGSVESLRSATVYATRLTDLLVISRAVFEGMLCQVPEVLLKLTQKILRRQLHILQAAPAGIGALVITLIPARPEQQLNDFAIQLEQAFSALGKTLVLNANRFEQLYGKPGASQTALDHPTSLVVNAWLDEREQENRFVIYEALPAFDGNGRLSAWMQRCVEDADILLLVGEGHADPAPGAPEAALPQATTRARLELALLHRSDCQAPENTSAWLSSRSTSAFPIQAHHHVRQNNPADFRRLSRRLSAQPVGLALGGGGARGWAHIGAIQALEEANIEVDWVGGASIGAILAGGYAMDWPVERLYQLAKKFSDPKKLLDYTFPYTSVFATRRITALLEDLCQGINIEDTWRPFFCVSANLTRGEEQLHLQGPLWKAVRASMAFPGVFAPILDNDCVLIDGGAANNLPVDRMREFCPTGTVIGVDLVTGSPVNGTYDFGPSLSGWQALASRLTPNHNPVKAPNLFDIVNGLVYSNNRYRLNEVWRSADLIIRVPVEDYGLLEFDKFSQIVDQGYRTAIEQLEGFNRN